MSKWCGKVGYAICTENPANSGIWIDSIVEKTHYGDLILRRSRWESAGQINDNLNITNEVSMIADPYALRNFSTIKYVEIMGTKWKVSSVEIQRPRLILTVGGVYNGESA